jgi:hypothetical protein
MVKCEMKNNVVFSGRVVFCFVYFQFDLGLLQNIMFLSLLLVFLGPLANMHTK